MLNYLSNPINSFYSNVLNYDHTFDFTTQLDQVIEFKAEKEDTLKRCVQAALPILSFYQPLRTPMVLFSSILQIRSLCKSDEKDEKKILIRAAGLVAALYASTNYPRVVPFVTLTCQLYSNRTEILARDKAAIFKAICTLTYISSLYFRISELAAVSMLMRAGKELYDSKNEFDNGRYIEGYAKTLLAFLRASQLKDEMGGLYQKYSGEETTQNKPDTSEPTPPENTQEKETSSSGELSEGENLKPPAQDIQLEEPSINEGTDNKDPIEGEESNVLPRDTQQEENPLSEGFEREAPLQGDSGEETPYSEELKLNDSLSEELS